MSNKRRLLQDDDEDEEDASAIDLTGNSSPLPKKPVGPPKLVAAKPEQSMWLDEDDVVPAPLPAPAPKRQRVDAPQPPQPSIAQPARVVPNYVQQVREVLPERTVEEIMALAAAVGSEDAMQLVDMLFSEGSQKVDDEPHAPALPQAPRPPQPPQPPPNPNHQVDEELVDKTAPKKLKGLADFLQELLDIYPDVDPEFGMQVLEEQLPLGLEMEILGRVVAHIADLPTYPKAAKGKTGSNKKVDFFKITEPMEGINHQKYENQALQQLKNDFPTINVPDIRRCYHEKYRRYATTWKYIADQIRFPDQNKLFRTVGVRKAHEVDPATMHIVLKDEVQFVRAYTASVPDLLVPRLPAKAGAAAEAAAEDIECNCCYDTFAFENMVQCNEGHLFCRQCLKRYIEQAVFDAGNMDMSCLGGDCKATFNRSQLDRALPDAIKTKLEERKAEKDLEGIEGLDKCPFCPYAEFNDNPNDSVLVCKNPECAKESCRKCKEENHIPKRCEEVEKSTDTKKRLTIEEKMTEIRIRTCHKCKTRFFKTEGCNKMTCRCGALMCYICREAIPASIGYNHFCQHVHEPGKGCQQCKKCVLFTNAEQDDLMAVEEARKLAEAETGGAGLVKATEVPAAPPGRPGMPVPVFAQPQPVGFFGGLVGNIWGVGVPAALPVQIPLPPPGAFPAVAMAAPRRRGRRHR